MKIFFKNQTGAVALVDTIIIAVAVLSISSSVMLISLQNRHVLNSYDHSLTDFYSAEAGVTEALMRLRKEPNNFSFPDIIINTTTVSTQFIDEVASCGEGLECDTNLQSTATSSRATRKVRYSCDNDISNCFWAELIP